MKLSVSSYSFQQAIKAGKMTQFDTIAAAHEIGLSAIEFIDLTPVYGEKPTLEEQKEYAVQLRTVFAEPVEEGCGIAHAAGGIGAAYTAAGAQQAVAAVRMARDAEALDGDGGGLHGYFSCSRANSSSARRHRRWISSVSWGS